MLNHVLPSDRRMLRCIYDMYFEHYPEKGDPYLPVDLHAIADRLGCSPQLLFGRLYYDMGTRLRVRDPKDPKVTIAAIFEVKVGDQMHCVNFPYLAAHLAGMDEEQRRTAWTRGLAIAAFAVSLASLTWQISRPTVTNVSGSPMAASASKFGASAGVAIKEPRAASAP